MYIHTWKDKSSMGKKKRPRSPPAKLKKISERTDKHTRLKMEMI